MRERENFNEKNKQPIDSRSQLLDPSIYDNIFL